MNTADTNRRQFLQGTAAVAAFGFSPEAESHQPTQNFALSQHRAEWLHHPVIGDPSWDTFEREHGNPIHTGTSQYPWSVNGFLFFDPVSHRWYAFVSVYPRGYFGSPQANTLLLRENKAGNWEALRTIFHSETVPYLSEPGKPGLLTDASVVYDQGKYHLLFGWANHDNTRGGIGYAWADDVEGEYHIAPVPVHDDAKQTPIWNRYIRAYASTLIRRKHDWLILHMMSTPRNAGGTWALFAMTAAKPEGPYSAPVPLLAPQTEQFHPPLAEFFPAFVHAGTVYAPATSVAMNRSFQTLFHAPVEAAHTPEEWMLGQHGSMWHTAPVASEAKGIWGQTFSGQVMSDGTLRALFCCKNADDIGTVGIARRPLHRPYHDGFVLSAPNAPAFALLRRTYNDFLLTTDIGAVGEWAICWDCRNPLGSNHAYADCVPHRLMHTERVEWRRHSDGWTLVRLDKEGNPEHLAEGKLSRTARNETVTIKRKGAQVQIGVGGQSVWRGTVSLGEGRIELLAETKANLEVKRLEIAGEWQRGRETWLSTEALAGSAALPSDWNAANAPEFRYGTGFVSVRTGTRAKWNWIGKGFALFAPRRPDFGTGRVLLDGKEIARLDFHAPQTERSAVVLQRVLPTGRHALTLEAVAGTIPCDALEVVADADLNAAALR